MDQTNYLRDAKINFFLREDADTISASTDIAWALFTTSTTTTGGGTEMTGGTPAYARQPLTFSDPALTGDTQNTAAIAVPCSGETVVAVAIMDSTSGGNMMYHEVLTSAIATSDGDTLDWSTGTIDVEER